MICTFSSLLWILSSYLLCNLSSFGITSSFNLYILWSYNEELIISMEESMNSRSAYFTVRQNRISVSYWKDKAIKLSWRKFYLLLRFSYGLFWSFVTLLMDLYWKTVMNGISYHHSFYLKKVHSFNLLLPLLWTPLQIEFSQNTVFNRGHHNKPRRHFWTCSRKLLCQKEIRNHFKYLK